MKGDGSINAMEGHNIESMKLGFLLECSSNVQQAFVYYLHVHIIQCNQ